MVRRTLRSSLWVLVVALGVLARPLHAQNPTVGVGTPAGAVPVKTYTGFFDNTAVFFTAFETNSPSFASVNGLVYAPRLSSSYRNGLADMIFFQGGAAGQTVVLQTAPGRGDYSPLWNVLVASWRGPGAAPAITSYAAAVQWWQLGRLAIQRTGIVFNGPVVWVNMTLNRQGGRLAPTISPQEFVSINPANRTVFFRAHPTYYAGQVVSFLALEHALGVINFAPGAIPVPKIGVNYLGHNAIANLYEVQGQSIPVIDSVPLGQVSVTNPTTPGYSAAGIAGKPGGVFDDKDKDKDPFPPQTGGQTGQQPVGGQTGQQPVSGVPGQQPVSGVPGQQPVSGVPGQQPVSGVPGQPVGDQPTVYQDPGSNPGATNPATSPGYGSPSYSTIYSPIWHVHRVVFRQGVAPRPLRSVQEINQALQFGHVFLAGGGAQDTFNCPVVTAPQPTPYTGTNPSTGGNPVYNPTPSGDTFPLVPPGGGY